MFPLPGMTGVADGAGFTVEPEPIALTCLGASGFERAVGLARHLRVRSAMSYPGIIALLVCSLGVILSSFALQFINSALPEKDRPGVPAWVLAVALFLFCAAACALRTSRFADGQLFVSINLTACLLAGIFSKWLCETVAQKKPVGHEAVLAKALIVAPLAVILLGGIFTARYRSGAFVLWFLNGYFWHALFSDLERIATPEKLVIRRREPPTLPHDFRKPEIG